MNKLQKIIDAMTVLVVCLMVAAITASFMHSVVKVAQYEADRARYAPVDKERLKIYTAAAMENQAVSDFRFYASRTGQVK